MVVGCAMEGSSCRLAKLLWCANHGQTSARPASRGGQQVAWPSAGSIWYAGARGGLRRGSTGSTVVSFRARGHHTTRPQGRPKVTTRYYSSADPGARREKCSANVAESVRLSFAEVSVGSGAVNATTRSCSYPSVTKRTQAYQAPMQPTQSQGSLVVTRALLAHTVRSHDTQVAQTVGTTWPRLGDCQTI